MGATFHGHPQKSRLHATAPRFPCSASQSRPFAVRQYFWFTDSSAIEGTLVLPKSAGPQSTRSHGRALQENPPGIDPGTSSSPGRNSMGEARVFRCLGGRPGPPEMSRSLYTQDSGVRMQKFQIGEMAETNGRPRGQNGVGLLPHRQALGTPPPRGSGLCFRPGAGGTLPSWR